MTQLKCVEVKKPDKCSRESVRLWTLQTHPPHICDAASGLSTRLVMLLTIASNANRGSADSFFHAGSFRNTLHFAHQDQRAESAKLSM